MRLLRSFLSDRSGAFAVVLGVSAPVLVVMVGASIDFSNAVSAKRKLQTAVDSAALTAAGTLRLASSSKGTASSVATAQVQSVYPTDTSLVVSVTATVTDVNVAASRDVPAYILGVGGTRFTHISAQAKARALGSTLPTCLLTLDPSAQNALSVDDATIAASGCRVYSDSTSSSGIAVKNGGVLNAGSACSAGGYTLTGGGTFNPSPSSDCPALPDPLAYLTAPSVSSTCDYTKKDIPAGQIIPLLPGVYCGGINVSGSGSATMAPGTYIIKDGKLKVSGGASLTGVGVTIYLTGSQALLDVSGTAQMNLTAPSFGPLAGILIFEDRSATLGQAHKLDSKFSANLLGAIYLSRGSLEVGGTPVSGGLGVGSSAAWTIAVVRQLSLSQKQSLVFNTNYGATTVPPPSSLVSTISGTPTLVQ